MEAVLWTDMWVAVGVLILAFSLGWLVGDFRALSVAALLGLVAAVVHLTSEDRETHWVYGVLLGAGIATSVGVAILLGIALRRTRARKAKGHGWLDRR
jgi:hypothetical protein